MKNKIFILICSLVATSFSNAEVTASQEQNCRNAMAMAMAAILTRYDGTSLGIALENTDNMLRTGKASVQEVTVMRGILRDAYSQPRYSTSEYKKNQIQDFSAKYYLACMEASEYINRK